MKLFGRKMIACMLALWMAFALFPFSAFADLAEELPQESAGDASIAAQSENECPHTDANSDNVCDLCGQQLLIASGTCGENLSWTLDDNSTLTISGSGDMTNYDFESVAQWDSYRNQITSVIIGSGVRSIGDYAFYNCDALTEIEIPDNVETIGESAFRDCDSLARVSIGSGIGIIGNHAFYNCDALTAIEIPDNVEIIGVYAFCSCNRLARVSIGSGVTGIGESAFTDCAALTAIEIPNCVELIGESAFKNCNRLARVSIGNGVAIIGSYAFEGCNALTAIEIPCNVVTIGNYAFHSCAGLARVTIDSGVTIIGDWAFADCNALTDAFYDGTEADWSQITIGRENQWLTNVIRLNSHSHPLAPWTVTTQPTCTTEGVRKTRCTVCDETFTETIPVLGHVFGNPIPRKEPSYLSFGALVQVCARCAEEDTLVLEKLVPNKTVEADGDDHIAISFIEGVFEGNIKVNIKEELDGASFKILNKEKGAFKNKLFDITTTMDGVKVQPNGKVLVRLLLPEGYNSEKTVVYYVNSDVGTLEKMVSECHDGFIYFEAEHFSSYAIVEEEYTLGDVNGDGKVNAADARLILRAAARLEKQTDVQKLASDVNHDGKVTAADARIVLRVAAKLETL